MISFLLFAYEHKTTVCHETKIATSRITESDFCDSKSGFIKVPLMKFERLMNIR